MQACNFAKIAPAPYHAGKGDKSKGAVINIYVLCECVYNDRVNELGQLVSHWSTCTSGNVRK